MSNRAESTVLKRKLSQAEKDECSKVFTDMYSKATKAGLSPDEYQILNHVASASITTIRDLQLRYPWLNGPSKLTRSLIKRLMLHKQANYLALTNIGRIYLEAARTTLYPTHVAEASVGIALRRSPQIEGRVTLTPSCAYSPLCSGVTAFGILVTFVNRSNPDRGDGVDLEHRNYCCELHAAFDLLQTAANGMHVLYPDEETTYDAIADMARSSLNGEAQLGDKVSQSDIDSDVDRILGLADQA